MVDWGKILAESDDSVVREDALAKFQRALQETENSDLREEATLGSARIVMREKEYEKAMGLWKEYLKDRSWTIARPEANFRVGECLDELGKDAEAKKLFVSVYANFAGHLDWSIPAAVRVAEILKNNGQDVQALQVLGDTLKRVGHNKHPQVDEAKKTFFEWREEYVAKQARQ